MLKKKPRERQGLVRSLEFKMKNISAHFNFEPEDFEGVDVGYQERMDARSVSEKKRKCQQYRNRDGTRMKRPNITRGETWYDEFI